MAPANKASCCELRRQLAEQFAIAARLYAEAVVLVTRDPQVMEGDYQRLCKEVMRAQARAESAGLAFEEHVSLHQCGEPHADTLARLTTRGNGR